VSVRGVRRSDICDDAGSPQPQAPLGSRFRPNCHLLQSGDSDYLFAVDIGHSH
jgi:hypothetical protein